MAPGTITNRARAAWKAENLRRQQVAADAGQATSDLLDAIGLHECPHTFASLMIASEVNAKQLAAWMGHATITLDRYGHLMIGAEADGAAKLDRYLEASTM